MLGAVIVRDVVWTVAGKNERSESPFCLRDRALPGALLAENSILDVLWQRKICLPQILDKRLNIGLY